MGRWWAASTGMIQGSSQSGIRAEFPRIPMNLTIVATTCPPFCIKVYIDPLAVRGLCCALGDPPGKGRCCCNSTDWWDQGEQRSLAPGTLRLNEIAIAIRCSTCARNLRLNAAVGNVAGSRDVFEHVANFLSKHFANEPFGQLTSTSVLRVPIWVTRMT